MEFLITSVNPEKAEFCAEAQYGCKLIQAVFGFDNVKEIDLDFVKEGHVFQVDGKDLNFKKEYWTEEDIKEVEKAARRFSAIILNLP